MSLSTLRVARFPLSILISALVLVGLLLFPGPAFGVQTVTTAVSGASFNLGTPVPGTVTIDLEADEFIGLGVGNKATVSLDVTGPQAVSFSLPLDAGPFTVTQNGATLTGTISHDSRVTTGSFGGYGYGYKAGSTGGTITIAFNFTQQILLDPAPPILPQLPAVQDRTTLNLAGAQGAQTGPSAGQGIPSFPDFGFVGNASAPGVPFSSEARALDSRTATGGSFAILGAILDGNSGQNDVYAEFEVGADSFGPFVFPRTSFTLPNVTGFDMAALQGLAFISGTRIAVSGGFDNAGNDAFVAVLDLTGGNPATGASVVGSAGLGSGGGGLGLFDKATGGVEFDGTNILVAEYQSNPSGQVTIAKLNPNNLSTGAQSFNTPLGFAGAGGFDALGGDPNSGNPINRFFGVTEPPNFGGGPEDVRILEFDATGGPLGTHFPTGLPFGQAITGAGLIDNPTDSGNSALMFIITKNTKEVLVTAVAGAAAGPSGGQFTNEPQAVDYDSANDRYLVPVKGAPNSHLAILDGSFAELDRYELSAGGGLGEIGGAAFDNTDNSYWVVNANVPPTIYKINPDNNGAVLDSFTLPFFVGEVGALASQYDTGSNAGSSADDTLFLYAYEVFNDVFHKINTNTKQIVNTVNVFDNDFGDNFFPPFGATGATYTQINGVNRLVISRFNQVFTVDPSSGAMYKGFNVAASELTGLGNGSLLMADRGFGGSKIMASRLPGEEVAETTTVGDYSISTTVDNTAAGSNGEFGPQVVSSAVTFSLTKLSVVTVTVTAPTDGQAFTATPVGVVGSVDDQTVTQVIVSAGLASGTIAGEDLEGDGSPSGPSGFQDPDDAGQYSTSGNNNLWHTSANIPAMASPSGSTIGAGSNTVFYYGQGENSSGSGNPNYNTGFGPGGVNFGDLDSATVTVDGTGTNLDFDVWYATEPTPPGNLNNVFDRKQVQFCDFNGGCQNLFHIVSFVQGSGGGGGGGGFVFEPPPGLLPPGVQVGQTFNFEGQQAMFIPRERGGSLNGGGARFSHVTYNLDSLVGQTGFIRIKFHTQDDFNDSADQQGVIVDNFEVTGPLTTGETFAVTNGTFSFNLGIAEGSNSTTLIAKSAVPGTADGSATFTTILDTSAPTLTLNPVTSPTTFVSQTLTGTFVELSPSQLVVKVGGATAATQKTFAAGATTYSHTVGLSEGANSISVTLTDTSNQSATVVSNIVVDNTGPTITAAVRPILSDNGVRGGDDFFMIADADDGVGGTGIASVVLRLPDGSALSLSNTSMAAVGDAPDVIIKKHELGAFDSTTSTHVGMTAFATGTPAGAQQVIIDATDGAGNVGTTTINVNVVAALTDRNAYLTEGNNYVGFPLIPDTASVGTLLNQEVANVNPALISALGGTALLSDIIDLVYAYDSTASTPAFVNYSTGIGTDSFTTLNAFDGMIVNVLGSVTVASVSYDVFETGTVLGSTVKVPIKWNVPGVFTKAAPELPPSKQLAFGYNLWTPHATNAGLFEKPGFLRAAVVTPPGNLAVSAITQVNRIDAVADSAAPGGFDAEVESRFNSAGPGDTLDVMRSYWTYMVAPAIITP